MSQEKNSGYEAILQREREEEIGRQKKEGLEMAKIHNMKLEAMEKRVAALERVKGELEGEGERMRAECGSKAQIISRLAAELEELRAEALSKPTKNTETHHSYLSESRISQTEYISDLKSQIQTLTRLNTQLTE